MGIVEDHLYHVVLPCGASHVVLLVDGVHHRHVAGLLHVVHLVVSLGLLVGRYVELGVGRVGHDLVAGRVKVLSVNVEELEELAAQVLSDAFDGFVLLDTPLEQGDHHEDESIGAETPLVRVVEASLVEQVLQDEDQRLKDALVLVDVLFDEVDAPHSAVGAVHDGDIDVLPEVLLVASNLDHWEGRVLDELDLNELLFPLVQCYLNISEHTVLGYRVVTDLKHYVDIGPRQTQSGGETSEEMQLRVGHD